MGRLCSACVLPQRTTLDLELLKGESVRSLAAKYSLKQSSLQRHRHNHLSQELREKAALDSGGLAVLVTAALAEAERLQAVAEAKDDIRSAINALNSQHQILQTLARLSGALSHSSSGDVTNNNLIIADIPEEVQIKMARAFLETRPQLKEENDGVR